MYTYNFYNIVRQIYFHKNINKGDCLPGVAFCGALENLVL